MNINWTVRLKNKAFWLALIPSLLLLVQQLAAVCGFTLDLTGQQKQLTGLAGSVYTLLALAGAVALAARRRMTGK